MKEYVACEISFMPTLPHLSENRSIPKGFYVRLKRSSNLEWEVASDPYETYEKAVPRAMNLCKSLGIDKFWN